MEKILFVGAGNMAEGIIAGLIKDNMYESHDIYIDEALETRRKLMEYRYRVSVHDNQFAGYSVIVLAIRPQDFADVVKKLKGKIDKETIILSVCAGIDLAQMERDFGAEHKIVRVMTNVLIEVKHGYSAACINQNIQDQDKVIIQKICDALGQTEFIPESLFNEFTAFSCAGPAYVIYFLNAMIDAGV